MSDNEKLDTWGKWRRDAIQDYGNASLRYAQQGRKFMSALAAIGEAAADLAPHSAKGVAFELATTVTGLGAISKGFKAVGAVKDVVTAVKVVEKGAEIAHLGHSINHSVKNVAKALVKPEKIGSINSAKGHQIYNKVPAGFFKSTLPSSSSAPKPKTSAPLKHMTLRKIKPVVAQKSKLHLLNTTLKKPSILRTASTTGSSALTKKLSQPKLGGSGSLHKSVGSMHKTSFHRTGSSSMRRR